MRFWKALHEEARKVFMFGASGMGMAPLACYLAVVGLQWRHMMII